MSITTRPALLGINRAHPACRNPIFVGAAIAGVGAGSGTTTGLEFVDFLRGDRAGQSTLGGMEYSAGTVFPVVGLAHRAYAGGAANTWGIFSNRSTAAPLLLPITMALIGANVSSSTNCFGLTIGSSITAAVKLTNYTGYGAGVYVNGGNYQGGGSSGFTVVSNPFIAVISLAATGVLLCYVRDLVTGLVQTQTITGVPAPTAPDGSIYVSNGAYNSGTFSGFTAAALAANVALSSAQIVQWITQDPWGPWRPQVGNAEVLSVPASGGTSVTAVAATATAAAAALAPSLASGPSSVAATGAAAGLAPSESHGLTAAAATAAAASLTPSESAALSGVAATATAAPVLGLPPPGTIGLGGGGWLGLAGGGYIQLAPQPGLHAPAAAATAAAASLAPAITATAASVAATASGAALVPDPSGTLTGAAASATGAALAPGVAVALTGVAATGAAAAVSAGGNTSVSAVAVSATASAASLTPSIATSAVAVAASATAEALTPSPRAALAGASATGASAALTPSIGAGPASVAAAGFAANPVGGAMQGVAASGAAEAPVPSLATGALAVAATGAAAALSFAALVAPAVSTTAAAAPLGIDLSAALAAVAASGAAEALAPSDSPGAGAAAATGIAAALGIVSEITLSSVQALAFAGSVRGPLIPVAAYGVAGDVSGQIEALIASQRYTRAAGAWNYTGLHPALSYIRLALAGTMPWIKDFPPIAPSQEQTLAVDFGAFLPAGVTLAGSPNLTLSVHLGTDTDPASRVGAPQLGTAPTPNGSGIADDAVLFQFNGSQIGGVTYLYVITCDRTDSDVVEGWGRIPCIAPS